MPSLLDAPPRSRDTALEALTVEVLSHLATIADGDSASCVVSVPRGLCRKAKQALALKAELELQRSS